MSMSPPPPQAYTRDMLAAAFEWLHTQPGSVRELAQDSNSLVSLYLQSRRRASAASAARSQNMVTPGSEAFREELKTLAEGFKQFEGEPVVNRPLTAQIPLTSVIPQTKTAPTQVYAAPAQVVHHAAAQAAPVHSAPAPAAAAPAQQVYSAPTQIHHSAPVYNSTNYSYTNNTHADFTTTSALPGLSLDHKSMEILRRTQIQLNLSTEKEALRMLLTLGFERLKDILPKSE